MACEQVWVVAACFSEEAVITRFIERVLGVPGLVHLVLIDLVLIDDGSRDATVQWIRDFKTQRRCQDLLVPVTLLQLTGNFGKEAAKLAGRDHVRER